jgi:hypothetical protein
MNRNVVIVTLLAAVLGTAGALGFKSKAYPYTLNVPDDWQLRAVPDVDVAFAAPPVAGQVPVSFNVAVKSVPASLKVTLDDLRALMLKQAGESVKDFKQVSVTGVKIGELSGVELNFTGSEQSGSGQKVPMHWVQRIVLDNNVSYILTYGATQSAFDKSPRLARQVLNNFRLVKK